jgi:hypothetical protein
METGEGASIALQSSRRRVVENNSYPAVFTIIMGQHKIILTATSDIKGEMSHAKRLAAVAAPAA